MAGGGRLPVGERLARMDAEGGGAMARVARDAGTGVYDG
jgi:hypothetical protein